MNFLKSLKSKSLVAFAVIVASATNAFAQVDTATIESAATNTIAGVTVTGNQLIGIAAIFLVFSIVVPMLMRGKSGG